MFQIISNTGEIREKRCIRHVISRMVISSQTTSMVQVILVSVTHIYSLVTLRCHILFLRGWQQGWCRFSGQEKEWLILLGIFSLKKLRGDFIIVYNFLMSRSWGEGSDLFSMVTAIRPWETEWTCIRRISGLILEKLFHCEGSQVLKMVVLGSDLSTKSGKAEEVFGQCM